MGTIGRCSAIGIGLALAGCVTEAQIVHSKENLMAAAGFVMRPADTPARQASLAALPPDRFTVRTRGPQVVYLYADPLVCHCLWRGNQQQYARYRQEAFQQHLANEEAMAAEMNEDSGTDMGAWGPGW